RPLRETPDAPGGRPVRAVPGGRCGRHGGADAGRRGGPDRAAAGALGDPVRTGYLLGAPVPASGDRLGGAVLLGGRLLAAGLSRGGRGAFGLGRGWDLLRRTDGCGPGALLEFGEVRSCLSRGGRSRPRAASPMRASTSSCTRKAASGS